jgi:hypothetical protein
MTTNIVYDVKHKKESRPPVRLIFLTLLLLTPFFTVLSDEVYRIEIGKDFHQYSQSDLQRRVWELERAVWQLQQKIYHLENTKQDTWVCTISTMGNSYSGKGPTKAIASLNATESCKAARGDGFFCKDPKCDQ